MFTFLPHEARQAVAKEYKKRLLLIYVVIVAFASIAWIASLVPSYVLVTIRRDEMLAQKSTSTMAKDADRLTSIEKEVDLAREKISTLNLVTSKQSISFVLSKLFAHISPGIALNALSVTRGGTNGTLSISGVATTREALVSFSKTLEGEPFFKKVELPVSNFTKGRDVPFTISLSALF